jgi:virginiamycin A acetyltransferase
MWEKILVWPFLLRTRLNSGNRTFKRVSETLSLVPGTLGQKTRSYFYSRTLDKCAEDARFGLGTLLNYRNIMIGSQVSFGQYCSIGLADFEDYVLVSSNCHFLSGSRIHSFDDPLTPIRFQPTMRDRITIGRGSWIGVGAIVMASVGEGCVIGAGSVVTRPVPPYHVVAGNPAKVIRTRSASASSPLEST